VTSRRRTDGAIDWLLVFLFRRVASGTLPSWRNDENVPGSEAEPLRTPGVIGWLLVLIFSSLSVCLPAETSLSRAQLDALAAEALNHTPEYTHFAKGAKFSWVLFTHPAGRQLDLMSAIRRQLGRRYRVYDAEEDLPDGSVLTDDRGKRYVDGFLFTVTAKRVSADTVEMTYVDYEAPLAAGRQTIRYRWNGSRWQLIRRGPIFVS
jgi:hypothetical protein